MIVHSFLQSVIFLNQINIVKKLYNKLMLKYKIMLKYITLFTKYLINLYNIIESYFILDTLKITIIINYPKKVHSIPVRLHITNRRNQQVTHKFLSRF